MILVDFGIYKLQFHSLNLNEKLPIDIHISPCSWKCCVRFLHYIKGYGLINHQVPVITLTSSPIQIDVRI